jgi:hypothetical protein
MLSHQLGFPLPNEVGYGIWNWETVEGVRVARRPRLQFITALPEPGQSYRPSSQIARSG